MRVLSVAFVVALAGCGGGTNPSPSLDLSMSGGGDLEIYSLCGRPGDTGNSIGVGKYCTTTSMCMGQMASVCSTVMPIPQGPTYFCTTFCDITAANPNAACAENASCTCLSASNPSLCGCVPNVCRVGLFG